MRTDDGQSGPKSHLEVLAEMRDYKRRRQSYRAKNVHITKKSYTEVRLLLLMVCGSLWLNEIGNIALAVCNFIQVWFCFLHR